MIKEFLISCLLVFSLALVFVSSTNLAKAYDFEINSGAGDTGYAAGYNEANLTDDSFAMIVGRIIRVGIILLGIFFFLLMIYAGFIWMLSRGNSQDVEKAKKIMQNALIGLIVILLSYAVTYFVMSILSSPKLK